MRTLTINEVSPLKPFTVCVVAQFEDLHGGWIKLPVSPFRFQISAEYAQRHCPFSIYMVKNLHTKMHT